MASRAAAQTPKRGGTLSLRTWDPPHFDHILAHAYKTHVVISFTHSRLLRHKAGPGIRPGTLPIEGDLAESWQQTSEVEEYPSNVVNLIDMRTDKPPFSDVRVRQAVSLAMDRKGIIDSTLEGVGAVNGPLPAALSDWALPIAELGEGARYYRHDPVEARRLLAAAGYPNGLPASVCFATYGSTQLVDTMQLVLKDLKAVGIGATLDQKEYGAYQATCRLGKFDSMVFGPLTPFLEPDSFLFGQYYTGEPRNRSHVSDPVLDDVLVRQRRTADPKGRREVINQIERHLAKQQYYVQAPSGTYVGVWDAALKNYRPNLGYDYGGRLVAAWLDR